MGLYWIQKRSSSANLRLRLSVFQQSQIHKICLVLSSSALPWFHTGRVRISVVQLISLHHLHILVVPTGASVTSGFQCHTKHLHYHTVLHRVTSFHIPATMLTSSYTSYTYTRPPA